MATKTFEELKQMAIQIRDEKANKQNTATRIGTQMVEHLNKLEQEYYNKENIDEQKEQTDAKFSELEKEVGTNALELNESKEIGTDVLGYKTLYYECPFKFKKGNKYKIENISLSGKGISAALSTTADGDVVQSIGNINPQPPIEFTCEVDADYIGGYGSAWKVRVTQIETTKENALLGQKTYEFVLGNSTESMYESNQDVYLNYITGAVIDAGVNKLALSYPIQVKKGQLIVANLNTKYDFVAAIGLTNETGSTHYPVVKGVGNINKDYYYVAKTDGYIEISFSYDDVNTVTIYESPLLETIMDDLSKGRESYDFVFGTSTDVEYESEYDYYINYVNGNKVSAGSNKLAISTPIQVKRGQLIVARVNTIYDFVAAISRTDETGSTHFPVVKGEGNAIKDYYYIAEKNGYIEISFAYEDANSVTIYESPLFEQIIGINASSTDLSSINMGVDGDSITEGNQWSFYASQILGGNHYNVAVGSACWSYKEKNNIAGINLIKPQHYTDENFAGFGGTSNLTTDEAIQKWVNNNACTHIEKFVALVNDGTYPEPDIFVFAMGTNADTSNGNREGTIDEAMSAVSISDEDYVDDDGKSLKYSMCGAMRWCVETIKREYPACKVFVSLPIQRANYETNKTYLYPKVQLIKDMAIQLGCQIIDQYKGCGITAAIELDESPYGPYLRDGLHPKQDGQKLMGAFAASQIKSKYFVE